MVRISTVSTQPRQAPAIRPTAVPIRTPERVTAKAPRKLWWAPWRMRTAMSLPSSLIPNRNPSPGSVNDAPTGIVGLVVASIGPMKAISSRGQCLDRRLIAAPSRL